MTLYYSPPSGHHLGHHHRPSAPGCGLHGPRCGCKRSPGADARGAPASRRAPAHAEGARTLAPPTARTFDVGHGYRMLIDAPAFRARPRSDDFANSRPRSGRARHAARGASARGPLVGALHRSGLHATVTRPRWGPTWGITGAGAAPGAEITVMPQGGLTPPCADNFIPI